MSDEIKLFHHDDRGYDEWITQHEGYVLTASDRGEYMLHTSDCFHLGRDKRARILTRKPRRWAKQEAPLIAWSEQKTGTAPLQCQSCR
jgi:hypothetical protein